MADNQQTGYTDTFYAPPLGPLPLVHHRRSDGQTTWAGCCLPLGTACTATCRHQSL